MQITYLEMKINFLTQGFFYFWFNFFLLILTFYYRLFIRMSVLATSEYCFDAVILTI